MIRLLALVAVAVIAFACAPRPIPLVPSARSPEPVDPVPGIPEYELETEVPVWPYHGFCTSPFDHLDRFDKATLNEMISADHLGPPPIPELEEHNYTQPTYPGGRPPRDPRLKLLRDVGGNDASERALALGLAWVARQQRADGSWEFDGTEKEDRITATALVLLTYLGIGETHKTGEELAQERRRNYRLELCACFANVPPQSPGRWDLGRYRKTVAFGLRFLTKACPPSGPNAGKFAGASMTGQALAALVLVEAYCRTRDPDLKPHAQAAVNYLQKVQGPNGSWAGHASENGDLFTTAWVVQALHTARQAGDIFVDDRVIKKAVAFLNLAAGPRKSMYGTLGSADAKTGTTATAAGLLCRHLLDGWKEDHPGMIDGVAGLVKNRPDKNNRDPLYLYYATRVLARYGGEDWKLWNEGPKTADGVRKGGFRDVLVGSQIRPDDAAKLGSWDPTGEWGRLYGRLGTTALNVLTLEVYYRDLPLYKQN